MPNKELPDKTPRLYRGRRVTITPEQHAMFNEGIQKLAEQIDFGTITPLTQKQARELVRQGIPLGRENIVGFGYGLPRKRGKVVKDVAVVMYVVKKVSEDAVEKGYLAKEMIANVFGENFRSDVVETSIAELH